MKIPNCYGRWAKNVRLGRPQKLTDGNVWCALEYDYTILARLVFCLFRVLRPFLRDAGKEWLQAWVHRILRIE